jgi:hypothetical protein
MYPVVPITLADRFVCSLDGLYRAVAARIAGGALAAALIVLICGRIRRVQVRFLGILRRYQEGRLRVSSVTRAPVVRKERELVEPVGAPSPSLPLRFGWLLPLVPCHAAGFASQIRFWLGDPEVVALLTASPQARRTLGPLCRMLGIESALLSPGVPVVAPAADGADGVPVRAKRVRAKRVKVELPRLKWPRGVLAWARREGFGKR